MKKIFLNLNILNFLIVSNIGLIACGDKKTNTNTTTNKNKNYNSTYNMGETKDFDLKSFTVSDFQSLANDKISEEKNHSSNLEQEIKNKVLDTIFEQIIGNKTYISDELKALKQINQQVINFKFELINKNQQLKTIMEVNKWEDIERFFKFTAFPDPNHRLIKGLAELVGLNNVKKYYDHIKNNKSCFIIEYGDKTFYSSIENAKKILEEDNKLNLNKYQFYVELDPLHVTSSIKQQLNGHFQQLIKDQSAVKNIYCWF